MKPGSLLSSHVSTGRGAAVPNKEKLEEDQESGQQLVNATAEKKGQDLSGCRLLTSIVQIK